MDKHLRGQVKQLTALSLTVAAVALLWLALSAGGDTQTAIAQTADTPTPVPTQQQGDEFGDQQLPAIQGKLNPPRYSNMDSNLNQIVEQAQSGQFTALGAAANAPLNSGESVAVTLYITEGYAQDVRDWLEDNGVSPRNIGIDYIEAYVPVSLLPAASQQEHVISIRTIIPPQPAQGAVVSEGSAAHGAPAWHTAGIKGSGVKIGVIDGGFEGFTGLMGTELPASVQARCYTDIGVFTSNLSDCEVDSKHGTAVSEALFDIAPEATYYIANPNSFGDLQTAVQWMIDNDVDVINQSLAWWWDGPGDGTSPFSDSPLRAVDAAVAGGAAWVNSAGNGSQRSWFGPFEDTDGDGWHNYGAIDECNTIELKAGEIITILLRWDDNWLGASRDLDLFIAAFDSRGNLLFDDALTSEVEQSGRFGDYPFEIIQTFAANDLTACVSVKQFRGAPPAWMHLASFRNQTLEFHTLSGGIGNPAESANPGMLAVGAAPWSNTSSIEPYSDQGPTPDGRIKPDIVGADLGQSVTYRSADNPNGYFPGTSQASPHVAGLAALVKQRFPEYTPQQVTQYLKDNAEARGAVPNNTWGYGFANLPAIAPDPTATPTQVPTPGATPVTPQVPEEVLNRISALDTLVSSLQALIASLQSTIAALEGNITALDGRVTALETNASLPTPIPTPTLTATPTLVPGAPTPTPSATPTITPTVAADACVTHISADGAISGSWTSACLSTNRPLHPRKPDDGTYHAQYYSFDISASSSVTITLESSEDTYLYLLDGKGRTGSVVAENDDITPQDNVNSRIVETLQAGSYTIEAATYDSGITGNFTLTISGIQ